MAKFQIYQFMFRPINENQLELPFDDNITQMIPPVSLK